MKYIKFYRYLLPFYKKEILILFLSGIGMSLGLVNPYLTKLIIDKAYGNRDLKLFIILMVSGGIIFILNGIINGLSDYLNRYVELRLKFDLNRKIFKKLQSLSYGFFQESSTGQHLYKISYDINQVSHFISDVLPKAISLLPKFLFILVIILYMNWKMALFTLALMPFLYIMPYYFTRRLKKSSKVYIENSQGIFAKLQEVFSHIQLIKAFGRERQQIREYIRSLIKNIRLSLVNTRLDVMGSFANSLAHRIILGLIFFYGGYQVIQGRMTLGSLSAITIYLSQLSGLENSLAFFFQQISFGFISCQRLEVILDAQPKVLDDKRAKEFTFPEGGIEFKNVTFAYQAYPCNQKLSNQDKLILKNLSFSIPGGSCIGLVGYSGCGKTTVINLILRLYSLLKGEILIDGRDITNIKSKSLYEQIGVVLQESYLWNDTLENNILYGKEKAIFPEVIEAARIACINDFINSLPERYNTVMGENACKISEGQKQRIAIARAIIKRPKILILDEALSSVDAETEGRIINNIRGWLKESTIIVVSHRLSTIKRMDLIYLLVSSAKIDVGRHEEFLKNSHRYQDYLADQLKKEKESNLSEEVDHISIMVRNLIKDEFEYRPNTAHKEQI